MILGNAAVLNLPNTIRFVGAAVSVAGAYNFEAEDQAAPDEQVLTGMTFRLFLGPGKLKRDTSKLIEENGGEVVPASRSRKGAYRLVNKLDPNLVVRFASPLRPSSLCAADPRAF